MYSLEVEEPVLVDQSTLNDLEAIWSGNRRDFQVHHNPQEIFQVLFTVSAYVEADWSLTNELCYVAISESAMKLLYKKLNVSSSDRKKRRIMDRYWRLQVQPSSKMADLFASFRKVSTTRALSACLYRTSLQPKFENASTYDIRIRGSDGEVICGMGGDQKIRSRAITGFLYRHHTIGHNEPTAPFIHTSQRVEDLRSLRGEHVKSNPWGTHSISPGDGAIAAYSDNEFGNVLPETARCCMYIFHRKQTAILFLKLVLGRITFRYCFVTERLRLSSAKSICWNATYMRSRKRGPKRVAKLLFYLEATIFQNDNEESEKASDEGNDREDGTDDSDEDDSDEDDSDERKEAADDTRLDDAE